MEKVVDPQCSGTGQSGITGDLTLTANWDSWQSSVEYPLPVC